MQFAYKIQKHKNDMGEEVVGGGGGGGGGYIGHLRTKNNLSLLERGCVPFPEGLLPPTLLQAECLHLLHLCFLGILHVMSGSASQLDIGIEVLVNC